MQMQQLTKIMIKKRWTCISANIYSNYKSREKGMSFSIRCMQLNIKSQVILFHWLEDQHIILLLPELIHILINLISSPQFFWNHCVQCYTKQITYHSLSLHSNGIEQPYCSWQTSHDGIDIQSEIQPRLWTEAIGVSDFFVLSRSLWHEFHLFTQTSWYHGFRWIIVEIWWSGALVTTYK